MFVVYPSLPVCSLFVFAAIAGNESEPVDTIDCGWNHQIDPSPIKISELDAIASV